MKLPLFSILLSVYSSIYAQEAGLSMDALILDLDASKGITQDQDGRVISWKNQAPTARTLEFVKQDKGRSIPGSGCPTLRTGATPNQKPSIVFLQQELVCSDEDFFDDLSTGKGFTWIAILAVHEQRVGVQDVNSFFGNLRNGGMYEGVWGCFDDDNTIWFGARNGKSFGRFDDNNPRVSGPILKKNVFHIVAGRMQEGTGKAKLSLYLDTAKAHAEAIFPVNPEANPSRMAIGQERDAIEHPGYESFDGEISRFLIWRGALSDENLATAMKNLATEYAVSSYQKKSPSVSNPVGN